MFTKRLSIVSYLFVGLAFGFWIVGGSNFTGCSSAECTTKDDCSNGVNCVNGKCQGECTADKDCEAINKATCVNSMCQGCVNDKACTNAGEKCVGGLCRKGCKEDKDCAYLGKNTQGDAAICQTGTCILPCVAHTDCPAGNYCKARACAKGERPKTNKADELEACGDVGDTCESDEDCKKGSCYKGTCLVDCMDGLNCKSWAGGTVQYCYKGCKAGCGKKVCVPADAFADKTEVCMNPITKQGDYFSYSEGTYCDEKSGLRALQPARGSQGFGQGRCWVFCKLDTPSCEKGRKCVPVPVMSSPQGACFKPCNATSDCEGIQGLVCKSLSTPCQNDAECGELGKCESGKCKAGDYCLPRDY